MNKNLFTVFTAALVAIGLGITAQKSQSYPIDGYPYSGIKRLEYYRLADIGEIQGKTLPAGAKLSIDEVKPRLIGSNPPQELPTPSEQLSKQISQLIDQGGSRYSITVLDLSDPENIAYAEHNPEYLNNVGSVGKIIVAMAIFSKLAEIYPDSIADRERILRQSIIVADDFSKTDSHTVRYWDIEKQELQRHPIRVGDSASMFEYLDWMISPSSNAAAAMLQKHLILLSHFGKNYPVDAQTSQDFFADTPKKQLGDIFFEAMNNPLLAHGIDNTRLRQGSFFTRTGKSKVPGVRSYGNTRELMKLLYLMEQGKLVDEFSSTEIKRLMYNTERRIRYASHPALNNSAVYFKSGSLYKCVEEEGFSCGKYQGNDLNLLASLAIVESSENQQSLHYLVVVHSNVLKINSAVAHQTLGLRIHRLMQERHP